MAVTTMRKLCHLASQTNCRQDDHCSVPVKARDSYLHYHVQTGSLVHTVACLEWSVKQSEHEFGHSHAYSTWNLLTIDDSIYRKA